jgi:hypothetical protein
MYGGEVGRVVHENVALSGEFALGAPVALGDFLLYALFLLIAAFAVALRRGTIRSA